MRRRRGTILIVTIWVTLVLAGLVLMFGRSMRISAYAAANTVAQQQADAIMEGGIQYALSQLSSDEDVGTDKDDENLYQARPVGDGYVWLLRSDPEDDQKLKYGLNDEAAKVNLNSASLEMLMKLPGMTAQLAASIIDWRDSDDVLTEGGAESAYYLLKSNPYPCKNAPLQTLEEILLIQGGTQQILFGEDTNLNSKLDDNEDDGDLTEPEDNHNGKLDSGLYDYVTVYSQEKNVDADGNARVNINGNNWRSSLRTALENVLKADRVDEIMGPISGMSSTFKFNDLFQFYYMSGMTLKEFEQVADKLTTDANETRVGLINVNTAPEPVLECLPQLDTSDAEALIAKRQASSTNLDSIAWVTEVLDQAKAEAICNYITVHSYQYTADVIAVSGNGRAFRRAMVVLDRSDKVHPIRTWKSLTQLGWPLDRNILTKLKSGQSLQQ